MKATATPADAEAAATEHAFAKLVAALAKEPGVVPPGPGVGFGKGALRVDGKLAFVRG